MSLEGIKRQWVVQRVAVMNDEMKSLRECKAWKLTSLPPGSKTIGCRMIYKNKQNEQGKLIRYKARLVAQGSAVLD